MCLSKAYVNRNGETELLLEQVAAFMEIEKGWILSRVLFGGRRKYWKILEKLTSSIAKSF